jgi:membrane-associated phospholipid phosphatase
LLLAATVGTLRVLSGKHFPTDVLTGAVVGSALGWLIPELHRNKGSNTHLGLGVLGLNLRIMF